jgi:hypothetical protein
LPKLPKSIKPLNQSLFAVYLGNSLSYLKLPKLPKVGNIPFLGKILNLLLLIDYQYFTGFR